MARDLPEYESVKVYLKQGSVFIGKYEPDDYDDIYNSWIEQRKFITFANGEFLTSEVAGIEWVI